VSASEAKRFVGYLVILAFGLILLWLAQSALYLFFVLHRLITYRQQLRQLFASNESREQGLRQKPGFAGRYLSAEQIEAVDKYERSALSLLMDSTDSVIDVAYAVGFNSRSEFYTAFRQENRTMIRFKKLGIYLALAAMHATLATATHGQRAVYVAEAYPDHIQARRELQ